MTNNFDLPAFTGRIQDFVREEALWEARASLLVAVSGGPDSVALLDLLRKSFSRLRLTVAHVNHLLRPARRRKTRPSWRRWRPQYRLPYLYRQVDVPARVAETGESVEAAARELRYAALQEMAR